MSANFVFVIFFFLPYVENHFKTIINIQPFKEFKLHANGLKWTS